MTAAPKLGLDRSKTGRAKGTPNKTTALLKDAILKAAQAAGGGGDDGLVGYLTVQANENPGPFMALLGKVLPMQVVGDAENPVVTEIVIRGVASR
jgi:hypothetical protein